MGLVKGCLETCKELTGSVLACRAAVQAFCGSMHVGVGGGTGLAVGPLGRQAEANVRASPSAASLCYSYSCSRGIYAGTASPWWMMHV